MACQLPEWLASGLFPNRQAIKSLLQRQSPTPDKTLPLQVGRSVKVQKLQVGTRQVQSAPFSQRNEGLQVQAVCWTGSNNQRSDRRKSPACIKTEYSTSFINEGGGGGREERSGSKMALKFYTYFYQKKLDTGKEFNLH